MFNMEKIAKTNFESRIIAIDIIRIIAISLVVWIHCQEQINFNGLLSYFTYLLGRTGVPLFLMISGTLIFNKDINIKNFLTKRVLYLYIISVFWFYIYGSFHLTITKTIFSSLMLIPTAKHLWYLSMLPFLYFLTCFLSDIKKSSTINLIFLVLGCFLYKWLNIFLNFGNHSLDDYFVYIAYFIFGYTVYHRELYKKIPLRFLCLSVLVTITLFLLIQPQNIYNKLFNGYDIWWYYSPFIVIFSLQIYILLLNLCTRIHTFSHHLRTLSENCFGVYIIHLLVLTKMYFLTNNLFLLFIITIIISFLVTILLSDLPIMNFLFYKK